MIHGSRMVLVGVVFAAGLLGGALWTGAAGTPANAQPPAKAAGVGRYQVSAWGTGNPGVPAHGAYVVDTQTGDIYSVVRDDKPKRIGKVVDQ